MPRQLLFLAAVALLVASGCSDRVTIDIPEGATDVPTSAGTFASGRRR